MKQSPLNQFLFSDIPPLHVFEVELELHSIFWFHTLAQPREKYVHVSLPLIHNYPLTLALLGRPVEESYVSIAYKITKSVNAGEVWEKHGFYIYPAVATKMYVRQLLFSMGGTGYLTMKARTRAPIPDLTSHQVFLPGSVFKTYVIAKSREPSFPEFIRLGAKRYGVFKASYRYLGSTLPQENTSKPATHPFNVSDCESFSYHSVMVHYAGDVAISGIPKRVIDVKAVTLALPKFIRS
ncbi:MAG: hypothetical protein QXW41_07665 [Fervidicoccaceae archaeon]